MSSLDADVKKSLELANRAYERYSAALTIFQANVARRDFAGAEAERAKLHESLDEYLDNYAAAGKRMEAFDARGE